MPGSERKRDERWRIVVHPLFLLLGIASAFTGQFLLFVSAGIAAIEHELAHAIVARRYGFRLNKLMLMPYGAVIKGDVVGANKKEELKILLAGPLANGATALAFLALWWLFPETYPYTQTAMDVSLSLFAVNLLPAYPLDGGRIFNLFLRPLGEKRAKIIRLVVTVSIALAIVGYFIFSCFSKPAFSALFFACFLVAGAFGGGKYEYLRFFKEKSLARGLEEKRIAISSDCTLGNALRFLRDDSYLVFVLYDGEEFLGELSEREFYAALQKGDYALKLSDCLAPLG